MAATAGITEQFAEQGFLGPVRVLSRNDCRSFLRAVDPEPPEPLDWEKGLAPTSRAYYEIATRPEILDVVSELLGDDVVLWGASIQERIPDAVHPWHSDIESSAPDGRTVTVWIGVEHTTADSSLAVVSHSHRAGVTVQQLRQERGKDRWETTGEDLVAWARERDGRSELVTLRATDGEAVFMDGRLWHGSHNVSRQTRRALLLQYAAPETAIRIPDPERFDWPFRLLDNPRPPCLIVRGSGTEHPNRFVPGPTANGRANGKPPLTSRIHPLRLPLEPDEQEGWKPYPAFSGPTATLPSFSCHASALVHGHSPHPPHTHAEEEILLLLSGEVELELANGRNHLQPGELVYYPAGFAHTLRTTSAEPANYLMFKWRGEPAAGGWALSFGRFATSGGSGLLFEGPTQYLRKLHSHLTVLEPGGGYEPHVDSYDVAIVVLEGEVETIGGRAVPHDVIFYRAGEAHGMRNVGAGAARYVVFELHGRTSFASGVPSAARLLLARLSDPQRWKEKVRSLAQRARG